MPSLSKLYFHDATNPVGGTLPGAPVGRSPSRESATARTLRMMDDIIGASQVSVVDTTAATAAQSNLYRRFASKPLSAQTIASQTITVRLAASESNAASNMFSSGVFYLFLWRPSTGANIGVLVDITVITEPGTGETSIVASGTSTARTAQAGDILVLEIYSAQSQSMATSYTNTIYYDGTTEQSATSNAAHIEFTNAVTFPDPVVEQKAYRFRNDDGSETTATWKAAQNVGATLPIDNGFRLRFEVEESAGIDKAFGSPFLQYRKNGGAWTDLGVFTGIQYNTSSFVTNLDATTNQLTAGTETFAAGQIRAGSAAAGPTLSGHTHTEYEFVLYADSAATTDPAGPGDVFEFRIVGIDTYTQIPSLTIGAGATTYQKAGSLTTAGRQSGADAATLGRAGAVLSTTRQSAADAATRGRAGSLLTTALESGVAVKPAGAQQKAGSLLTTALQSGIRTREFGERAGLVVGKSILSGTNAKEKPRTGALTTQAILSGADVATFAEAGALVVTPRLSGADVHEAVESGLLRASGLVSGSDAATLARTAYVAAQSLLAGADAYQATETGAILSESILAGTGAKSGSSTGAVIAAARLSGVDADIVARAGSLAARGIMAAVDAWEDTESGVLTTKALLAGADAYVAGEAGSLIATGRMSGADAQTLAETGLLLSRALLSGMYSKGLDKAGSIATAARLSGIDAPSFAETGSLVAGTFGSGVKVLTRTKTGFIYSRGEIYGGDVHIAVKTGAVIAATNLSALEGIERARAGAVLTQAVLSGIWQMLSGYFMTGTEPHYLTGAAVEGGKLVGAGPEEAVVVATTVEQAKLTNVEG